METTIPMSFYKTKAFISGPMYALKHTEKDIVQVMLRILIPRINKEAIPPRPRVQNMSPDLVNMAAMVRWKFMRNSRIAVCIPETASRFICLSSRIRIIQYIRHSRKKYLSWIPRLKNPYNTYQNIIADHCQLWRMNATKAVLESGKDGLLVFCGGTQMSITVSM